MGHNHENFLIALIIAFIIIFLVAFICHAHFRRDMFTLIQVVLFIATVNLILHYSREVGKRHRREKNLSKNAWKKVQS
jgi:undecaprenyl pyrophosphate phosphatase UppP